MSRPRNNSLAPINGKYFNEKVRFSINRYQANQLVKVLKKSFQSQKSSHAIQELRDTVYFKSRHCATQGDDKPASAGTTIALSGPVGKEGSTTVSLLLFLSLAELKNRKVLFVDGSFDPDRFRIYRELFNLNKIPVDFGNSIGDFSFQSSPGSNLCFLSISNLDPMDFFSNVEIDDLLEEFKECFDYVVFDMPPFLKFSETKFFFPRVDLSFLVVSPGKTLSEDVERCKQITAEVDGKINGVVLNRQHLPFWTRFFGREAFL